MGVFINGARLSLSAAPRRGLARLFVAPTIEPLTVTQGKLRAGLDWSDGDPRDALMTGFIASARQQVEIDTGIALLTQTHDVAVEGGARIVELPLRPIQSITSITWTDSDNAIHVLDPADYTFDPGGVAPVAARLSLAPAAWPSELREFQPWTIRVVAGFASVALLTASAPGLIDAVGLLVAHAATAGRDRFTAASLRDEYAEKIAPYQLVVVP